MSRTPQHVFDDEMADQVCDDSSSSTVYFYDKSVVLYTPSYIGTYKYRLYKSLDLLYSYSIVNSPHSNHYKVHRIEVKKLESLSSYLYKKYVESEQHYFADNYVGRYGSINAWIDARKMLKTILSDPKLNIYKMAFAPLKGMWFKHWIQFWMDDCTFNFMYDRDTSRVIPIDLFI